MKGYRGVSEDNSRRVAESSLRAGTGANDVFVQRRFPSDSIRHEELDSAAMVGPPRGDCRRADAAVGASVTTDTDDGAESRRRRRRDRRSDETCSNGLV